MTVLPMITAPASRRFATTSASDSATLVGPALRAAGRRQSRHVDDVFDADRNPMKRAAILAVFQLIIQSACLFERPLAVEHDPGVDLGSHSSTCARQPFEDLDA